MPDQSISESLAGGESESEPLGDLAGKPASTKALPILATVFIMVLSIVLTTVFKEDIADIGGRALTAYGRAWLDVILVAVSIVSSGPAVLPIWPYELVGIQMGFSIERLSFVMAVGAATGSIATLYVGRFFGKTEWVKKRFPNIHNHPWAEGRSRAYVTAILFFGTASPIPIDVFYAAAGAKLYPAWLFWLIMIPARFIRYWYTGYWLLYFGFLVDKII